MEYMTEVPRHLSPADAADLLDVDVRDVLELIDSGDLPAAVIGGRTRIPQPSLEAWLADRAEAGRRAALWHESQTASVADLFGDRRR